MDIGLEFSVLAFTFTPTYYWAQAHLSLKILYIPTYITLTIKAFYFWGKKILHWL